MFHDKESFQGQNDGTFFFTPVRVEAMTIVMVEGEESVPGQVFKAACKAWGQQAALLKFPDKRSGDVPEERESGAP